ncbi:MULTISPECIES: hypothetical protein [unclassified Frankia]|uniref:hypothetical protein n=1 Tax=unclassified Frankia TaxID=2632575 RepID=UPI001EF5170A|nr:MULTISPECIES: hypothetical protein [unclassified Frankia]
MATDDNAAGRDAGSHEPDSPILGRSNARRPASGPVNADTDRAEPAGAASRAAATGIRRLAPCPPARPSAGGDVPVGHDRAFTVR